MILKGSIIEFHKNIENLDSYPSYLFPLSRPFAVPDPLHDRVHERSMNFFDSFMTVLSLPKNVH
jgi:hypothetical protein